MQNLIQNVSVGPAKDTDFVTALARGMSILTCFGADELELGNGQIARRTGLAPATVARLTHTLTELGYLRSIPRRLKYTLSANVLSIGYPLLAGLPERELARKHIKELADLTHGSTCMALTDGLHAVYVDASRGREAGQAPDIGVRRPLLDSSVGRALYADMDAQDQASVLNQSCLREPGRVDVLREGARRAVEDFSRYGMCRTADLVIPGWSSVAMPVRGFSGRRFAVSVGVITESVPESNFMRIVGMPLAETVSRIKSSIQMAKRADAMQ